MSLDHNLLITINPKHPDRFFVETKKDVDIFGWQTISKHKSYYMNMSPYNLIDLVENKDKLGIVIKYDDIVLPVVERLRDELRAVKQARKFKIMPEKDLLEIWEAEGFLKLFPKVKVDTYQIRMILWMLAVKKGCCYFEPGLGKTLAGTIFLGKLLKDGLIKKPLVIAPAPLLSNTMWFSEIEKFSDLKPINLRDSDCMIEGDIYFVNSDKLQSWCFQKTDEAENSYNEINFFEMMRFDGIFVDESAVFKNHASYRSNAMMRINKYVKYLGLASGVPSPNNIFQIFAQMNLCRSVLGDSYSAFEQRYGYIRDVGPTKKYFPKIY